MSVISVSQLNKCIKSILDGSDILSRVFVVGEISNFKHYNMRNQSGHMYLTLKDNKSQISCVMYSWNASKLKFKPVDGMKVICRGSVSMYDVTGQTQFYIDDMKPDGAGDLAVAFEQLKEKLDAEGLFDKSHKKPIPEYPKVIGVATSNMGAAIMDIKNILKRRYPLAEVIVAPTIVQGDLASADIVNSIELLDSIEDIDVIIVGRGGGSLEDLWAFNTEPVARAVYNCKKPIISAVGHETDFTICDFVADFRAETPSAAAEKATPDSNELIRFIESANSRMSYSLNSKLTREYQRFDSLTADSPISNIDEYFQSKLDVLDDLSTDLISSYNDFVNQKLLTLKSTADMINALNPLAVLSRGFSAVSQNDKLVKSVKEIETNAKLKLNFNDGIALCNVDEVIINE